MTTKPRVAKAVPRPRTAETKATIPVSTEARVAGLRHVHDEGLGLRRARSGRGFRYLDDDGTTVRDPSTLARIRALAIPPAWREVWICPSEDGHIQATGRDDRGRKQYRYHARWREHRDETKYARMVPFARALPTIRDRVRRDLNRRGLPREKVLALVVKLLETSMIRVGNDEYARSNKSYGLTTMRDKHASVSGGTIHFEFKGKSGVRHAIDVRDPRLARLVLQCRDLPGQELFQYRDEDGGVRDIGSADVNAYLREITGEDFTAKDFRTWAGTVLAAMALREFEQFDSETQAKKNVVRAIETVSARLGNTPSVCRKCYVHPAVLETYLDGSMLDTLKQRADKELADLSNLEPEEAAVLTLIRRALEDRADQAESPARHHRHRKAK